MSSEPKKYTIEQVSDLASVPPAKLRDCLYDLHSWVAILRLAPMGIKILDEPGKCSSKRFVWIDDGRSDINMRLSIDQEDRPKGS